MDFVSKPKISINLDRIEKKTVLLRSESNNTKTPQTLKGPTFPLIPYFFHDQQLHNKLLHPVYLHLVTKFQESLQPK